MIFVKDERLKVNENRYRKYFDETKLAELANSIADCGLINLPVAREVDGQYELVAGERRTKAIRLLWQQDRPVCYMGKEVAKGYFPCSLFNELDEVTARQIEIEENSIRADLTWQEHAAAVAHLHELRLQQNEGWTAADTAEELTGKRTNSTTVVRDQILLADHLNDPAVAKAPSPKEALKQVKAKLQRELETELGKMVASKPQESKHTLLLVDAIKGMGELQSNQFEVILTDPPYGIDADNFHNSCDNDHQYDDSWSSVQNLMEYFFAEAWRLTTDKAHLYVFCDVRRFEALAEMARNCGFDVWPTPIIWVKDVGSIPRANFGPRRMYESILYALKGDRPVTALYPDVITVATEKNKVHAAQKPVELYVNLLRRSVYPGSKVLDPFCGSGTIFEAAEQMKCLAVGMDSDPAAVGQSKKRLEAMTAQPSLFAELGI